MDKQAALRRKVLRGSLAAPVVLTVSSASAATTSFGRCLANSPGTTAAPFFQPDKTSDKMFRIQVPVQGLWWAGQDQGYFYSDPVKNCYVSVTSPNGALPFGPANMPAWCKPTTTSTRWALVWFDKGTATQYTKITLAQPLNSAACTVSCYGSLTPGKVV